MPAASTRTAASSPRTASCSSALSAGCRRRNGARSTMSIGVARRKGNPSQPDAEGASPRNVWARTAGRLRENAVLAGAIAAGLAARVAFWAITDRRLDDALITLKFDKNFANGVG